MSRLRWPCVGCVLQGEVLMSIEIMPKAVADVRKAGLGRSEPNMNPYLPPPTGRMKFVRCTRRRTPRGTAAQSIERHDAPCPTCSRPDMALRDLCGTVSCGAVSCGTCRA